MEVNIKAVAGLLLVIVKVVVSNEVLLGNRVLAVSQGLCLSGSK
jgi:hypothetical protein